MFQMPAEWEGATQRLAQLENRYRAQPGARRGGSGATGAHSYDDYRANLDSQDEYDGLISSLAGLQTAAQGTR